MWGGWTPAGACQGERLLLSASVLPAQSHYGSLGDFLVVHGKEKVYGSIP